MWVLHLIWLCPSKEARVDSIRLQMTVLTVMTPPTQHAFQYYGTTLCEPSFGTPPNSLGRASKKHSSFVKNLESLLCFRINFIFVFVFCFKLRWCSLEKKISIFSAILDWMRFFLTREDFFLIIVVSRGCRRRKKKSKLNFRVISVFFFMSEEELLQVQIFLFFQKYFVTFAKNSKFLTFT